MMTQFNEQSCFINVTETFLQCWKPVSVTEKTFIDVNETFIDVREAFYGIEES